MINGMMKQNVKYCYLVCDRQLINFCCVFVDSDTGKGCSQRLVACLSTLHLFGKIKPDLMVKHATTLQPYLDIKCSVSFTQKQ